MTVESDRPTAKFRIVPISRSEEQTVAASAITLGTSADCELLVRDPIADPEHCRIVHEDGQFVLVDGPSPGAASSTGTFVNGRAVIEPHRLAAGDRILLGKTRVVVAALEGDLITLQIQKEAFQYRTPEKGENLGDHDQWVYREARFGEIRSLRVAGWIGWLAVLVGLPLVLIPVSTRHAFLEPGPLCTDHASLFDAEQRASFRQSVASHSRSTTLLCYASKAEAQSCGACHEPFEGVLDEGCNLCHSDLLENQHPFALKHRTDPDPTKVSSGASGESCVGCHVEHQATEGFVPALDVWREQCDRCHGGTELELWYRDPKYKPKRDPANVSRDRTANYYSFQFGHDDHKEIKCQHCHQARPQARANAGTALDEPQQADFEEVVPFEKCSGCHRLGHLDPGLKSLHPKPEHQWEIRWHGTDDEDSTCHRCHEPLKLHEKPGLSPEQRDLLAARNYFSKERISVERHDLGEDALEVYVRFRARFELPRRSHHEQFVARTLACTSCHRNETTLSAAQPQECTFWHALHLPFDLADQAGPVGSLAVRSTDCLDCHGAVAEAHDLTRCPDLYQVEKNRCAHCHNEVRKDAQGVIIVPITRDPLTLVEVSAPRDLSTVLQENFPHDAHANFKNPKLKDGCFTCHEFQKAGPDPSAFSWIPVTKPPMKQCVTCHEDHQNVGGDACQNCHPLEPGRYSEFYGRLPPGVPQKVWPPERPKPPDRPWPLPNSFNHFSGGHVGVDCQRCHNGIADSKSLQDVPIPDESQPECRACHLEQRARFHWR